MGTSSVTLNRDEIPAMLRGEPALMDASMQRGTAGKVLFYVAVVFMGGGLFGAAVGCWRAPLQAVYTALKLPLILLLTALGNGLLNGMLAPLLGLNISFRQSLLAVLMSFTIAAAILGSFSPLLFFLVWNAPPMGQQAHWSEVAHSLILLVQALVIAFAGVAANLRLSQLLCRLGGSRDVERKKNIAWM